MNAKNKDQGRFTMRRTTTPGKALLIGFLVLLSISQPGIVSAGTNVWTSIGPEGGNINALAIDPATPTTLYAGTFGGGAFKSKVLMSLLHNPPHSH